MTEKIKVISLFDGIGGARQALKELNIDCDYFASEIDKYAIQVAKANHPDIIQLGDIKKLEFSVEPFSWKGHVKDEFLLPNGDLLTSGCDKENMLHIEGEVDIIFAGFPCQSYSVAGNRKGLEDERGQLIYDVFRALRDCQPKYFLLENVKGLLSIDKGQTFKNILEELDNCGYDVSWKLINSALLTAQNRNRVYIVGKRKDIEGSLEIEQPEDQGIYLKDIIEENVDEKYYISEKALKTYTFNEKVKNLKDLNGKSSTLTATTYKGFGNDGCTVIATQLGNSKNWGNAVNNTGKAFTLRASQPNGVIVSEASSEHKSNYRIRKLTPTECCRLQGFPDSFVSMVSNTQGYKALGNSFTVPVIKHILQTILKQQ